MKILLTGSTGYIGRRLLPVLLEAGHQVICLVRYRRKFDWDGFPKESLNQINVVEGDLGDEKSLAHVVQDVDVAFYLVHSMSSGSTDFADRERESALNFANLVERCNAKQIVYLGGIVNDQELSAHLQSRKNVEDTLRKSKVHVTVLRAAIIIGSGSASFEIIRDLVEKLPVMIAPRWLKTQCQPIAIRNVLEYLYGVMLKEDAFDKTFDIGGTAILSYKDMLYGFAKVRGLKRLIISVPILTPRLSSLWLALVTSTSYPLARALVNSMKNEVICQYHGIDKIVPIRLFSYEEALKLAFEKISHKNIISSWKDSYYLQPPDRQMMENILVPGHGVFTDKREISFQRPVEEVVGNLWSIGGNKVVAYSWPRRQTRGWCRSSARQKKR
jgi:uncharacterized protein YbjT (DUF2867 family)